MYGNEITGPAQGGVAACVVPVAAATRLWRPDDADEVPDDDPEPELPDPGDLEINDLPGGNDAYWDVFIPDDDECDPLPEPGDFWLEERASRSAHPASRIALP